MESPAEEEESAVRASVGDRIVIRGHRVGQPQRDCEVLEVMGADGGSPYVVRWGESGHETVFFPGSDATVKHFEHASQHDPACRPGRPRPAGDRGCDIRPPRRSASRRRVRGRPVP
jgi:hypothetical protein